jgi:hypothetical protein
MVGEHLEYGVGRKERMDSRAVVEFTHIAYFFQRHRTCEVLFVRENEKRRA